MAKKKLEVVELNKRKEQITDAICSSVVGVRWFEHPTSSSRRAMSVCSQELHTTSCAFVYFSNALWSWISHCFHIVQPCLWALCGHWWFSKKTISKFYTHKSKETSRPKPARWWLYILYISNNVLAITASLSLSSKL